MITLKLWVLYPKPELEKFNNPWRLYSDRCFGFVMRAETEKKARLLAHENAGKEKIYWTKGCTEKKQPWLDPEYSTCVELTTDGSEGVVLREFLSG